MRRRAPVQQMLCDALTLAGDVGMTLEEIALVIYRENSVVTKRQVLNLINRARYYSTRPLAIERRLAYRMRPASDVTAAEAP